MHIPNEDVQQRFATEIVNGDMRYAMEHVLWRSQHVCSMESRNGDDQYRCSIATLNGGVESSFSMEILIQIQILILLRCSMICHHCRSQFALVHPAGKGSF